MFGEISLMAWMGGAIVFAIGGAAGFFIARQIKDKRTLELEQQLESTQNKLTEYQDDVNRHFLKTSLLFSKLTDNYREVYEHLATGAQKLCNDKPLTTALDLPDTKILSAASPASMMDTKDEEAGVDEDATQASANAPTDYPRKSKESAAQMPEPAADPEDMDTIAAVEAGPMVDMQAASEEIAEENDPSVEAAATRSDNTMANEEASPAKTASAEKDADKAPSPSKAELKALEANEKKKSEEEEVPLGAESTPGVELEHHKTHPSIH